MPVACLSSSREKPIQEVLPVLPGNIRQLLDRLPESFLEQVEEIRLRQGRPLVLGLAGKDVFVADDGSTTDSASGAYLVTPADINRLVQAISSSSLYALEEELRNGFITLPGGHRVGMSGRAVVEKGKVKTLKHLSCFNIRVSREIIGSADTVLNYLVDRSRSTIYHTVLVSPPRCGKTTLLRDLIRRISNGGPEPDLPGLTVGVVDERSEIAACYQGVPQRDVGMRTDVLDGCPKAEGMMLLLRAMGPQVIATDEIGRQEDIAALEEVMNAGVKVLATVHGSSITELAVRPSLAYLFQLKMVERFVILGRSRGVGTIEEIIDGKSLQPVGVKPCLN